MNLLVAFDLLMQEQNVSRALDNLATHKPKRDMWFTRHKNVHYHSTPTHTSWLNQSEIWFSILAGQSLKGASFCAVGELKLHIDAFIKDYNETAKPCCWTKAKVRQRAGSANLNRAMSGVSA